jgi:hypothetical protein
VLVQVPRRSQAEVAEAMKAVFVQRDEKSAKAKAADLVRQLAVSRVLCKRLPSSIRFLEPKLSPDRVPAGAARRDFAWAGTAHSRPGRARFWRGEADPCRRAPFWH